MGTLEMHGVTKPVSIQASHVGEGKDPWGGYRSGFEGTVTIKAADFGMPDWVGDVEVGLVVEGLRPYFDQVFHRLTALDQAPCFSRGSFYSAV